LVPFGPHGRGQAPRIAEKEELAGPASRSFSIEGFCVSGIKTIIRRSVQPIHLRFRSGKAGQFISLLSTRHAGRLLDVGGGTGMNGEFIPLYQRFDSVTVANLNPPALDGDREYKLRIVIADGRSLPFANHSFDWVFSNAVIEHVGNWEEQQLFAAEIRRVASRGYFVTTPNLYFPIEPHALLPLYQFCPARLKPFALRFSPGYMKEVEPIHLLTRQKLQALFPGACVQRVNLTSALIAFHAG
jgi:SAM-dependent methyltransferase